MKTKMLRRLFLFLFILSSLQSFAKDVTLLISQVPRQVGYAFTIGRLSAMQVVEDYQLFDQIKVYGSEGEIGTFSTNHGHYVSFKFVGGGSPTYYNDRQVSWSESLELAFYSAWNENKLSAFVINRGTGYVYLVDLESDAIVASFPIKITGGQALSMCIYVFSGGLSITAYHGIVINLDGEFTHYKELPTTSVNTPEMKKNYQEGIFNMKGQKVESMEPGINILVDKDGKTTKVLSPR